MLTKEQLADLYGQMRTPYSESEINEHLEAREIKTALEATYAHNMRLIRIVRKWDDFLKGKTQRPRGSLSRLLIPGRNHENNACKYLETITDYFSQFEDGSLPRYPIVVFAMRSTLALLELLESMHPSSHLDMAHYHVNELIDTLDYYGLPRFSKAALKNRIKTNIEGFIEECKANAKLLSKWINNPNDTTDKKTDGFNEHDRKQIGVICSIAKDTNSAVKETKSTVKETKSTLKEMNSTLKETKSIVKRIDKRGVRQGKRKRDIELQEFCFNLWNGARQNSQIPRCRNGKVKHIDVFNYYKRELSSRGITKFEEFSSLLRRRSNRLSIHASRTHLGKKA